MIFVFLNLERHIKILDDGYAEKENFCFWLTCKDAGGDWKRHVYIPDFFTVKGIVESLLLTVNVKDVEFGAPENFEKGIFQTVCKDEHELGMILQAILLSFNGSTSGSR
jgi:hypothetical protein